MSAKKKATSSKASTKAKGSQEPEAQKKRKPRLKPWTKPEKSPEEIEDEQVAASDPELRIQHPKKLLMLQALKATFGIVATAADQINISRHTHIHWMNNDPDYAQAVDLLRERMIDLSESKLAQLINGVTVQRETKDGPVVYREAPNVTAIIFHLKCIGKKRGYVERTEVDLRKKGKTRVIGPNAD